MLRSTSAAALTLLFLTSCGGHEAKPPTCPKPPRIAPPTIDAGYIAALTDRLAGPDRENTITEAISEIHARDPALDATAVTNILIAADCPNALSRPDQDPVADRARIANFRALVDQLLGS